LLHLSPLECLPLTLLTSFRRLSPFFSPSARTTTYILRRSSILTRRVGDWPSIHPHPIDNHLHIVAQEPEL
jgi:hypothetical protein